MGQMDKNYYKQLFVKNIGIITEEEQDALHNSCISIAGMGGVGGIYIATLARMGIGKFIIADPDIFEYKNMNRQYGASVHTINNNKCNVMKEIAESINPGVTIRIIEGGVDEINVDRFIDQSNLVIDAVDSSNLKIKNLIHTVANQNNLWSIKATPLGFGATMQVFSPGCTSFSDYYGLNDEKNIYENVMNGIAPDRLFERYLKKGVYNKTPGQTEDFPSFCPGVNLAGAMVANEAAMILLGKRQHVKTPLSVQLDLHDWVLVNNHKQK